MSCETDSLGVPIFESRDSARDYAAESDLTVVEGEVEFLGVHRKWIKIDFGSHLHHSEFRGEKLHGMSAFLHPEAESGRDGRIAPATPPTPPGMRLRTGRFQ